MWSAICRAGRPLEASGPSVEDLEHSRYFLTEWMPPLLRETAERSPPRVLADLGAGDGGTLWPLDRAGLVGEAIYAVDISTEHVALCERLSPKVRGIVSDLTHVDELEDGSVDAVVSSQVIEHLPDDMVLAPEIARILRSPASSAGRTRSGCTRASRPRPNAGSSIRLTCASTRRSSTSGRRSSTRISSSTSCAHHG